MRDIRQKCASALRACWVVAAAFLRDVSCESQLTQVDAPLAQGVWQAVFEGCLGRDAYF